MERRADLTDLLFKLWLSPSEPFKFKAGQYCAIGVDGLERPYSIVSAPHEPLLELFVELLPAPHGVLTPRLHRLRPGDEVTLRPRAKGLFTFKPEYRSHLMICTVTGVAPYVSILRDLLERDGDFGAREFHILQGASYQNEFAYDAELARLARRFDNLYYAPTVSRPRASLNADWRGATGRVNALALDYIGRAGIDVAETLIYACGHPAMVDAMRSHSAELKARFAEERFWKE